jgi:site-specific recombinase XerC
MGKSKPPQVAGPLAPYAAGFRQVLLDQGYASRSADHLLLLMAHASRWLTGQGLEAADLTGDAVERFVAARRDAGYSHHLSLSGMVPLLNHLRAVGVVPHAVPTTAATALEALVERYADYLVEERGLAPLSMAGYLRAAEVALTHWSVAGELDLAGLTASRVTEFVLAECRRGTAANATRMPSRLRSLLRFLFVDGLTDTDTDLTAAVPSVPDRRAESLPKAVDAGDVARMLESCDRRTTVGRRDFAILVVLARLGLRAGELARLQLDDLDWRNGEVVVRGKGNSVARLPLPVDVGEAIVGWLRRGRPRCDTPYVFVRVRAPPTAGVSTVVARACRRAGLPTVHAHRLRHTAATEVLRAGGSLVEAGQTLRHHSQLSTVWYARVQTS